MKLPKHVIVITLILSTKITYASELNSIEYMSMTANISGMCGAIKQMHIFQFENKLPEGENFVAKFVKSESERLGMASPEELTRFCVITTSNYRKIESIINNEQVDYP